MTRTFRKLGHRYLLLIVLPLLVSGCIQEFYRGSSFPWFAGTSGTSAGAAGAAGEDAATYKTEPQKQEKDAQPALPVLQEQSGPRISAPPSPETTMPAQQALSREPDKPRSNVAASPRRLAGGKAPDFSYTEAVFAEDVAWHGEVLVTGVVTVAPQATLTIAPGTVIRFGSTTDSAAKALLLVQGRVVATGTKDQPVVFSSRFTEPGKGDWQGIVMLGSDKKNVFEHCFLAGAETGIEASFSTIALTDVVVSRSGTGMRFHDAVVTLRSGGGNGCTTGIVLTDSEADLHDVELSGNVSGLTMERSSLYLAGGRFSGNELTGLQAADSRLKIVSCEVNANGAGIALRSSQGSISGCRIARNADYGVYLSGSRVKVVGNDIVKNGTAGLKVEGGMGAAWGNSLDANGTCDLINAGTEDFMAVGNWWGDVNPGEIGKRVCDRHSDGKLGRVSYLPVITSKPALRP